MKLLREYYSKSWNHAVLLLVFCFWVNIFTSFTPYFLSFPLFSHLSSLLSSPPPFPSFPSSLLHFSFFLLSPSFFHKTHSESMLCTQPCVNYGDMWKHKQDTPDLPWIFKLEDLDGKLENKVRNYNSIK